MPHHEGSFSAKPQLLIPLFAAGLFIVCMGLHGELVARKPAPAQLTAFYLMISLGGVAGSALVAWLAPAFLTAVFDLPLLLVATALCLLFLFYGRSWYGDAVWTATSIIAVVLAMAQIRGFSSGTRVALRNFYGSLRVLDSNLDASGSRIRQLVNGGTLHGSQFLDPERKRDATTYYARGTGVAIALEECRRGAQSVGIIGLGAGTLATFAKAGDHYVFFELNPQVIEVARREFTFLSHPAVEIVEGDGRLALQRDPRVFDILVVDAFSDDAIPVHLLTMEAMEIYWKHLQPDGMLLLHITNTILDLEPAVQKLGEARGLASVLVDSDPDPKLHRADATWVLMARSTARLRAPALDGVARPLRGDSGQRLWTDDYSNLFELLRWRRRAAGKLP